MIRFSRIEIENFVCFEELTIEPSLDDDRPLTVIRAENASGKTTFLRAVRWGMYGERGLPGDQTSFGVHPTFWEPSDAGIDTKVAISFSSDGSTRHDSSAGPEEKQYRLVRSVRTIARDADPGYQRINEDAQLMVKSAGGSWEQHSHGVDHVISQLLPWELRDFFVMDADEAAEFVGGSEGITINRGEVEKKTTYAVNALLGLHVFKEAANRVAKAEQAFGSKATKAVGDVDLDEMERLRKETREHIDDLNEKVKSGEQRLAALRDEHAQHEEKLHEELKGLGAHDELQESVKRNKGDMKQASRDHEAALASLAGALEASSLLARLSSERVAASADYLRPDYESGQIPQRHLKFVRELLDAGKCVCGEDLSQAGSHRRHIEDRLAESERGAEHANFLGHIYEAAQGLQQIAGATDWVSDVTASETRLAETGQWISALQAEKADLDKKLDGISHSEIPVLKSAMAALASQIERQTTENFQNESRLPALASELDGLVKKIHARQNDESAAAGHRRAEDLAGEVKRILDNAYEAIQTSQVAELSGEMNRLFASMVDNVTEDEVSGSQMGKETIRTIAEVGTRRTSGEGFEIFAINNHGRDKPHIEINGASRRVIALAFVLALCSESKTRAPLIADSLLNMMSGAVRRNTLATTAERSGQPILLLTGADLEGDSEVETVRERAGATYTLTAQWHGEVVNQTDARAISLVCECGPRQYCKICEREGQANRVGWKSRE